MLTSLPVPNTNLLVLVHYGGGEARMTELANALAAAVSDALHIPVQTAYLEATAPSVGEAIQAGIAEHQPRHVIVLPLFRGASAARQNNVQQIVDAAEERWSWVAVQSGKPLGSHPGVITAYSQRLMTTLQADAAIAARDTALLVVGRGSRDAENNAEVYQMARLLWETCQTGMVEAAFYGITQPDIAEGLRRCSQAGARRIIVLPYVLYDQPLYDVIQAQVQQYQPLYPETELVLAAHSGIQPDMLDAISQRYHEALTELTTQLASNTRRVSTHSHGAGGTHAHVIARPASQLDTLLPPRYQAGAAISAAPMGAADLIFDATGNVAWDEIWGDFCDLALAGGPPHRGTLLEPVPPERITAAPEAYQRVLAELERGLRLVTKLPVIADAYPGWIGLQCTDEAMALWLLRAIVVENISVRREDTVLYLPAGPDFRLEYEIKNVITVIAKTHHYWTEHITNPKPAG